MKRKTKRVLLIIAILILSVLIVMVMFATKKPPEKRPPQVTDLLVDTVVLEAADVTFNVRSQGTVRPKTQTILSAEVSGTITEISPRFVAGGVFAAGEVLLRIDPTNYEVAVDQASALVDQRTIEFEGAKKLRSQGYRAESEYASAVAALASAKAELVRARRNLERTFIRLPYDGIVRAKDADLGQYVNIGTRLGVTFGTDLAEVRLPLTDNDLAFIELPGSGGRSTEPMAVELTAVRRGVLQSWDAEIVRSEGVVDESSRVTYLVAQVTDPYGLKSSLESLPVGTFVAAKIAGTSYDGVIRAPRAALRGSDQLMFVEDGRLQLRTVDLLRSDAEFAYIRTGAEAGDEIITTALESPVNGTRVRTLDDSAAEGSEDSASSAIEGMNADE